MGKEKQRKIGVIASQIIKHKGIFNFNAILDAIPDWLSQHNYDYVQKGHAQKAKPSGGYFEGNWIAEKEVTEYVKFNISVDIWLRDLKDIAIEKNGKTEKSNKGNIEITFNSGMEKDYKKTFTNKKYQETEFLKLIREFYEKYVIKSKLSSYEEKIEAETQDFIEYIKTFLHK
jgi:hypothetical protein